MLEAVPGSRLLIARNTLRGAVLDAVRREFASRGIAHERLDLRHELPAAGHLTLFNDIDIALDTYPWSGGTITCEALWMGVPTPTLPGTRRPSRLAASPLTYAGLAEWIAPTPDAYVALVADLARDIDRLARWRRALRDRVRTTLGDGRRFTRSLEAAYRSMWQKYCSAQSRSVAPTLAGDATRAFSAPANI